MTAAKFTIINIGTLSMNKFWGESERKRSPSSTCTLLDLGDAKILVDPSPAPELLEAMLLNAIGIKPEAIDMIFITHFHGDHRFGLDLFQGKPWLMAGAGLQEWREMVPGDQHIWERFEAAGTRLPQGIQLLSTPGHTKNHCSLQMETCWGSLIVAGDAVMTIDHFNAEEGFHNSVDAPRAKTTIREIKNSADIVVPGHGNFFVNPRQVR